MRYRVIEAADLPYGMEPSRRRGDRGLFLIYDGKGLPSSSHLRTCNRALADLACGLLNQYEEKTLPSKPGKT